MIYEVKDWNFEHYSWRKNNSGYINLFVTNSKGSNEIKNPVDQVKHYKEK